jgi:hypothetical protein
MMRKLFHIENQMQLQRTTNPPYIFASSDKTCGVFAAAD